MYHDRDNNEKDGEINQMRDKSGREIIALIERFIISVYSGECIYLQSRGNCTPKHSEASTDTHHAFKGHILLTILR